MSIIVSSVRSAEPHNRVKFPPLSNSWMLVESSVATYINVPSVVIATISPPRFVIGFAHFHIEESKTSMMSSEATKILFPIWITEFIFVPLGELTISILWE